MKAAMSVVGERPQDGEMNMEQTVKTNEDFRLLDVTLCSLVDGFQF
jgi:hypothetical protein